MNQEKRTLKIYSAEFRASSVKLAIDSDLPIAHTAKDLGINPNTLHTWINKYSQPKDQNKAVRTDEHLYDELKRLKKEIVRLTEERDLLKKAAAYFARRTTVKYAWIKQHEAEFSVKSMCQHMTVSRSAYYAWRVRPLTAIEKDDIELIEIIKTLFQKGRKNYGTRRLKKALLSQGRQVSRRRIGRLMAAAGLACKTKRKFIATTNSNHELPIAPNFLDRQFTMQQPDQAYVGDITYIYTLEGWLYLAVVIDLYSRQVVGWSMAEHMRAKLVNDALLMAVWKRKPSKGLIWHTDRGSQYASDSHRALLKEHGITQSMSRKGNCWDNAVSESFFHTLKTELVHHQHYQTRAEAKQDIFEYIEVFYNRERIHSANNYLSPVDYELQLKSA